MYDAIELSKYTTEEKFLASNPFVYKENVLLEVPMPICKIK
jgi:hypothetical protein